MLCKLLWVCFVLCQLTAVPEKIVVGLSADYPPFEFRKGEEIVGFDVDLAYEIGKQLGVEIKIEDMAFAAGSATILCHQAAFCNNFGAT